jgi:hypothetical protein
METLQNYTLAELERLYAQAVRHGMASLALKINCEIVRRVGCLEAW